MIGQKGNIFEVRLGAEERARSAAALVIADKHPEYVYVCPVVAKTFGSPMDIPCEMDGSNGKQYQKHLGGSLYVRTDTIQSIKRERLVSHMANATPFTMIAVRDSLRLVLDLKDEL